MSEPTALEEAKRSASILFWFVVIFTACLSGAYLSTKDSIDASAAAATLSKIEEVLPSSAYNNALLDEAIKLPATPELGQAGENLIYRARLNGKPTALVAEAIAPDGYAGKIRLIVAISADQQLLGVRVVEHKETPGLGDYIEPRKDKNKAHPWVLQFTDLSLADITDAEWKVKKDGGKFDYRAGATVTPPCRRQSSPQSRNLLGPKLGQALEHANQRTIKMISREEFLQIASNGAWKQNTSLVQVLGLCPLLAVTTNMVNGVMLSLATIMVMALSGIAIASLRNLIPYEIRIPIFILIVAALVTVVDLLFNAYLHSLYLILGIFIPLIVTNCIVLARVEAFAAKNPPLQATFDGIFMGIGMLWTLALLGALRELIGGGTLLSGIDLVFPSLQPLQILPADYPGFLLAMLPPGAFVLLGVLIAWKNWVEARAAKRAKQNAPEPIATAGCH